MSLIYRVDCEECNATLDYKVELDSDDDLTVIVTPCQKCLDSLREELEEEKKNEIESAMESGYEEGRTEGYEEGLAEGREIGHTEGYEAAKTSAAEDAAGEDI